jgi:DNA-damage-inducible protein D
LLNVVLLYAELSVVLWREEKTAKTTEPNSINKHRKKMENALTSFEGKTIRKIWHDEQWFFSVKTRKALTDEWQNRGVKVGQEYSILTAIIAKGTFGLTPKEHKELKTLTKPAQNLRDHKTPLELIFTSLGEETTRQLAIKDNAQGFNQNQDKAVKGGKATGKLLESYEKDTGLTVVSSENYLDGLKSGASELGESDKVK